MKQNKQKLTPLIVIIKCKYYVRAAASSSLAPHDKPNKRGHFKLRYNKDRIKATLALTGYYIKHIKKMKNL